MQVMTRVAGAAPLLTVRGLPAVRGLLAVAALLAMASPATTRTVLEAAQGAATPSAADPLDRVVNDPRPAAAAPYGFRIPPLVITDRKVQFGKALRLPIPREVGDGGSMGFTMPLIKPIAAGDRVVIAFWARAHRTEGGAPGRIARVRLEERAPPHREIFAQPVVVGPEWKMHQISGSADRAYAPGEIGIAMHLAAARQTIDIGPVFVLRYAA